MYITLAAAEGDEIAAEAVQVAILGHTDSKNRCPKKKSFELKASRAASPVVEQRQAAQYERFGQMLSVRIGKMPAPLLKVYKTKHLRRGPVSGRSKQIAAEAVQVAILGHTDPKNIRKIGAQRKKVLN